MLGTRTAAVLTAAIAQPAGTLARKRSAFGLLASGLARTGRLVVVGRFEDVVVVSKMADTVHNFFQAALWCCVDN